MFMHWIHVFAVLWIDLASIVTCNLRHFKIIIWVRQWTFQGIIMWSISRSSQFLHQVHYSTNMWCDLRKPSTWSTLKKISFLYLVKVWTELFLKLFTFLFYLSHIKSLWSNELRRFTRSHYEKTGFKVCINWHFSPRGGFSQIPSHISFVFEAPVTNGAYWYYIVRLSRLSHALWIRKSWFRQSNCSRWLVRSPFTGSKSS